MSTEYGRIGTEVAQSFRNNNGIFTPQDIIELDQENKWTNFGQLELIETQTVSSTVSAIDFQNIKQDTYTIHFVTYNNVQSTSDNKKIQVQFFENGVLEISNVYQVGTFTQDAGGGSSVVTSTGTTAIRVSDNTGNETNRKINGYFYCFYMGDSTKYPFLSFHGGSVDTIPNYQFEFGNGLMTQQSYVDGFRIALSGGNYTTDSSFSLYGIRSF